MKEMRCLHSFLGKSKGKILCEIARRKRKDNITLYLKDIVWGRCVWINLAQNIDERCVLMNMIEHVLL